MSSPPPMSHEEAVRKANREVERLRIEYLKIVPHARLMKKRFYHSIARALLDHGKNLAELEFELGLTLGGVSGDEEIDMNKIVQIALYARVSIQELFSGCHCYGQSEHVLDNGDQENGEKSEE